MSIEVRRIDKSFGAFAALKGVDLEIRTGELVALLGPSGSGKTTLLRIIAGLEAPDSGGVFFGGSDAAGRPVKDRGVGFVFQHYALFKHMSVFENVAFGLRVRRRNFRPSEAEIRRRVTELLSLVQLEAVGDRFPSQLSGGQRQRIALARALAVEPRVLLLDEPFGSLDAGVRRELRRWLRRFHDDFGTTSLFVTHDQEEALEVADRIVVMREGRVEQVGTPDEVYHRPVNQFVLGFLGSVNLFHCRREDDPGAKPERVFVRPHHFEVLRTPTGESSLKARVLFVNSAGALVKLELRTELEDHVQVEISQEKFCELGIKKDDEVYLNPRRFELADYSI